MNFRRHRLPQWEQNLFFFFQSIRKMEMEWGEFDCVVGLANGAVKAQTGFDLAKDFRGSYNSMSSALKFLKENNWTQGTLSASLEKMMDNFLRRARQGDRHRGNIVLLDTVEGAGFGVRIGSEAMALSREGGLLKLRLPDGIPEWTVNE